ncbi:hypothetical protein YTPLAS72_26820 [Nitrospira sp.]|nr:hypothetical protein YTPLAS72_26820 [Nitrospira sp.]
MAAERQADIVEKHARGDDHADLVYNQVRRSGQWLRGKEPAWWRGGRGAALWLREWLLLSLKFEALLNIEESFKNGEQSGDEPGYGAA